jgi:ABC-type lipoprotein export system ATPase subunit
LLADRLAVERAGRLAAEHDLRLVLLGPSGSGKSTLLNILGGLDTPTSGTVRLREHDLTAATDSELTVFRRDHVRFVFQFYNLIPSLTAREKVGLVARISRRPAHASCSFCTARRLQRDADRAIFGERGTGWHRYKHADAPPRNAVARDLLCLGLCE